MKALQQDWVKKWAVYSPNKVAVKDFDTQRTYTYLELNHLANALAFHFQDSFKILKGDRIAILAENCIESYVLFSVAQKMGCILVPLNYRLTSSEIDYLLQNADPKLVITENKFQNKIKKCNHLTNIQNQWTIEELEAFCQTPENKAFSSGFPISIVDEDDPVFILYTSGTTGFPKGAIYSHKMLFWNSINTSMSLLINTESRSINVMPLFHTGGWNVLITPFLHHGGYMLMMKKFEPDQVLKALEEENVSIFMGVPTMLKMIAEDPGFSKVNLSSLYYLIVGGEPMPIPLIEQWEQKGVPVRQGFGMTEVGPNLTSLHQEDAIRKKGSIGRPNYYVETRIVDKNGNDCAPNQPGEFLLKGPMVTPGYWRNEKATEKAITDGWFHSGDMLICDEDGYLYVVDRIKNMYISGGENVYPAEIERVLRSHTEITAAAVISIPDAKWGEVGKAFIVKTTSSLLDEDKIKSFCTEHLAKFKVPKSVVFIDELPVNDTGKIDKLKLQSF